MLKQYFFLLSLFIVGNLVTLSFETKPKLANSQYIGYSFDVLYGQPAQQALRQPVIQLTWDPRNTIYINGTEYLVPLEATIISDPGFDQKSYTDVFTAKYQAEQQLSVSMSFKVGMRWCLPGMFSESTQVTFFASQFDSYQNYTAFTNLRVKSYVEQITPQKFNLTQNFIEDRSMLPLVFNSTTCPKFKKFISLYGTNVTVAGLMGGVVQMTTSFSSNLFNTYSMEEISEQIGYQFTLLTMNGALTAQQQQDLQTLNIRYISKFQLVGGDPGSFNQTEWQIWAESVFGNPVLIQYNLLPLSKFMLNSQQAESFELACAGYFGSSIQQGWTTVRPIPIVASGFWSVTAGSYIYNVGMNYPTDNSVYEYSPQSNAWAQIPSIPTTRVEYSVVALNQSFYVIGGTVFNTYSQAFNTVEMFNSINKLWYTMAPLNYARFDAWTFAYDNKIYVVGGCYLTSPGIYGMICDYNNTNYLPGEIYDPATNVWTVDNNLVPHGGVYSSANNYGASLLVNGDTVYIIMVGAGGSLDTYIHIYFYCAKNNFSVCGYAQYNLGFWEYYSMVSMNGDSIYIIGGCNLNAESFATYNNVYSYNVKTGIWTVEPPMEVPRCMGGASSYDGRIYAFGGIQTTSNGWNTLNVVEKYTPKSPFPFC